MKRWGTIVLALLLAGCHPAAKPNAKVQSALSARPFEAAAELSWQGKDYDATIERGHDGIEVASQACAAVSRVIPLCCSSRSVPSTNEG